MTEEREVSQNFESSKNVFNIQRGRSMGAHHHRGNHRSYNKGDAFLDFLEDVSWMPRYRGRAVNKKTDEI